VRAKERSAGAIKLVGGRLCLDFVNSIGARQERPDGQMVIRDETLNDYLDLVTWARHAKATTEAEAKALAKEASLQPSEAGRVLRLALRLREALYRIFKATLSGRAPDEGDLAILNEELLMAKGAQQIVSTENGFEWRWSRPGTSLEKILWLVSESASELLIRGDLSRLRRCGGDDCGWIFEDTTRNRSRHWCDMRDCGNRDHVRRFRQRQRKRLHSVPRSSN
jgi:predicted RNA-binding Zn ribbon-like protein